MKTLKVLSESDIRQACHEFLARRGQIAAAPGELTVGGRTPCPGQPVEFRLEVVGSPRTAVPCACRTSQTC